LHSKRKTSKTSKISNALSARLKLKTSKISKQHLAHLALFLQSRLESQTWNYFSSFPKVNGVAAGVPTPPDSGKSPQLRTSKLAQNSGKTEILHLQPSYGICWSDEIGTLPPV